MLAGLSSKSGMVGEWVVVVLDVCVLLFYAGAARRFCCCYALFLNMRPCCMMYAGQFQKGEISQKREQHVSLPLPQD